MKEFRNDTVDITSLPRYEETPLNPVNAKYWNVILINFGIRFLVFGLIILSALIAIEELKQFTWIIVLLYILYTILSFILNKRAFHKRGYTIRQRDIIYRRGLLSTITTIIPFHRIQHVSVNEGALSRAFGLAQLQIFTAGGSSSDIKISGLIKDEAEDVKELIMNQITENEPGSSE